MDRTDLLLDPIPARIASSAPTAPSPGSRTSRSTATGLIRGLLSGYPTLRDLHDPEGYITNLCSILLAYDEVDSRAGVQAVANLSKFAPTRFELRQACEDAAGRRVKLERMQALPPPQPTLRPERPADAPPPEGGQHPPGTILANYGEALKLYGRPIGAFEDGRVRPYDVSR
jgi:hypothetical protein